MPNDIVETMIEDVFQAVQADKPIGRSTFRNSLRLVDRNKRKVGVMVAAGVATAFVTAATGGVALVGVGLYFAAKGGVFAATRVWRRVKRKYYNKPLHAIVEEVKRKNQAQETLAVERVNGDLVAREALAPLLNKLRNEIHHTSLTRLMNDYEGFKRSTKSFDSLFADVKEEGISSCPQALQLLEKLGKMSRHYQRISKDFELICELATFLMLKKTQMDEEFRQRIDPYMEVLSGCYGRTNPQYAIPLVDLLNAAANTKAVLRHWNQRGGKDHRAWVGAVMGVEGKTDILPKWITASAATLDSISSSDEGTSATVEADRVEAEDPIDRGGRDVGDRAVVAAIGTGIGGGVAGGKVLSNALGIMKFNPGAIAGAASVAGGEALLDMFAEIANDYWNRYMLRKRKKLTFRGWKDLSDVEIMRLFRNEAKKDIEQMVDKFGNLLAAHKRWLTVSDQVHAYTQDFDTLMEAAVPLLRRQKLYWQIFHADSGLFINFAQFYECIALPTVMAEAKYLREDDSESSVHAQLEAKIRAWLASHHENGPCDGDCYMTVAQLHAQQGWDQVPNVDEMNQPIRPLGTKLREVLMETFG